MSSRRGKLHGIVVYAPVPEVSMMDLTIHVEREDPDLYRAVCGVMLAQAQGPLSSVLKYVKKMGDETRYSWTDCYYLVSIQLLLQCQWNILRMSLLCNI